MPKLVTLYIEDIDEDCDPVNWDFAAMLDVPTAEVISCHPVVDLTTDPLPPPMSRDQARELEKEWPPREVTLVYAKDHKLTAGRQLRDHSEIVRRALFGFDIRQARRGRLVGIRSDGACLWEHTYWLD